MASTYGQSKRELLENAAKAAGIAGFYRDGDFPGIVEPVIGGGDVPWNPLVNDGQALQLAVKLKIDLMFSREIHPMHAHHTVTAWADAQTRSDEFLRRDELAAVRRAIVRAAAEIGKPRNG